MPLISNQYLSDIESEIKASEALEMPKLSTAASSDIGRVRPTNEDAFFYSEDQGLWVVADGMGGLNRGDRASKAVVDNLRSFERLENLAENIKDLETRLILANTSCRTMFRRNVIGTTVVSFLAFEQYGLFLWAGDSRIYRLRDRALEQITQDHNLVQEKVVRGDLTAEEAEKDPSANVLTRAVGIHEDLRIEMQHAQLLPGDRYLLCSDGLYRDLSHSEIEELLTLGSTEEAVNQLIDLALERGGADNITAMVVELC